MFKKKATLAILMATLFVMAAPLAVQMIAGTWTCADLPSNCWNTTTRGCSGDVMCFSNCHMYCQTSDTISAGINCFLIIPYPYQFQEEPAKKIAD
jgi:hypothetical protein